MKELVSIKWTPAPKDAGGDAASMCPLCKKCFGASAQIKVLKVRAAPLSRVFLNVFSLPYDAAVAAGGRCSPSPDEQNSQPVRKETHH